MQWIRFTLSQPCCEAGDLVLPRLMMQMHFFKFQINPSELLFTWTHRNCGDESAFSLSLSGLLLLGCCPQTAFLWAINEKSGVSYGACPEDLWLINCYQFACRPSAACWVVRGQTFVVWWNYYISSSKTELDADEGGNAPVWDEGQSCESEKDMNEIPNYKDWIHVEVQSNETANIAKVCF